MALALTDKIAGSAIQVYRQMGEVNELMGCNR